jgi:hypothetical protein
MIINNLTSRSKSSKYQKKKPPGKQEPEKTKKWSSGKFAAKNAGAVPGDQNPYKKIFLCNSMFFLTFYEPFYKMV